jgi:citrate synthase
MASLIRTSKLTAQALHNFRSTATQRHASNLRLYSSSVEPSLKDTLKSKIPEKRELLKQVKSHADKKLGEVKVASALGGMRGLKAMIWEGSVLDANEGIRFHGKTIKDCQAELPKGKTGTEMLPEAMFWLLLTGDIPSEGQVRTLSREWAEKAQLPKHVEQMLDNFPPDLHPMTQFSCAVSALNYNSAFAKMYEKGMNKADYWEPTFDDSMELLAKLPVIAAKIYQNAYRGGGALPAEVDVEQDWSYNFAAMLGKGGKDNEGFQDLLRLYLALHGDHEGGNVSAHATHLVGSALSDPYLSYSAGLQGLAGPLHGLAAQEVVRWIIQMQKSVGEDASEESIKEYLWSTLKSGRVIPGYGHGVLRQPDPRFQALLDFAAARPEIAEDPLVKLVIKNSQVAPGVLKEHGKVCRDMQK